MGVRHGRQAWASNMGVKHGRQTWASGSMATHSDLYQTPQHPHLRNSAALSVRTRSESALAPNQSSAFRQIAQLQGVLSHSHLKSHYQSGSAHDSSPDNRSSCTIVGLHWASTLHMASGWIEWYAPKWAVPVVRAKLAHGPAYSSLATINIEGWSLLLTTHTRACNRLGI